MDYIDDTFTTDVSLSFLLPLFLPSFLPSFLSFILYIIKERKEEDPSFGKAHGSIDT